jgi:hypothetical protein
LRAKEDMKKSLQRILLLIFINMWIEFNVGRMAKNQPEVPHKDIVGSSGIRKMCLRTLVSIGLDVAIK